MLSNGRQAENRGLLNGNFALRANDTIEFPFQVRSNLNTVCCKARDTDVIFSVDAFGLLRGW